MKIAKRNSHRNHFQKRAYQRASISKTSNSAVFASNAFRYGHPPFYYQKTYPDFYNFLIRKEMTGKRVKVYKQWIFIFNSTNNNPTTMYPIPDEYLEAAEIVTINTTITFKLFGKDPITIRTTKSKSTLPHVKRYFAQLAKEHSLEGPFFLTEDGKIEHDFTCVGMWRVSTDR